MIKYNADADGPKYWHFVDGFEISFDPVGSILSAKGFYNRTKNAREYFNSWWSKQKFAKDEQVHDLIKTIFKSKEINLW